MLCKDSTTIIGRLNTALWRYFLSLQGINRTCLAETFACAIAVALPQLLAETTISIRNPVFIYFRQSNSGRYSSVRTVEWLEDGQKLPGFHLCEVIRPPGWIWVKCRLAANWLQV